MQHKPKGLSSLQKAIIEELKKSSDGLDIKEIRKRVPIEEDSQQHLDKRVRETYPFYIIERIQKGRRLVYKYIGERPPGTWDYETINKTLRAKILHRDGERCRMCGRTVKDDAVKLHVDHKIPREWGGKTVEDNLWSLCSVCNEGKKNYFSSFNTEVMADILSIRCVYRRIAMLLKAKSGEWVNSDLLEFVANFNDYQEDWQKRLRELRYTGLHILTQKTKEKKRVKSYYKITEWIELPEDVRAFVQKYERERAKRNRRTD